MQVWNVKEAAKFLRISSYTLLELVRAGAVPGAKLGGEWRFTDESLMEYMRNLVAGKPASAPEPAQKPAQKPVKRRRGAPPPPLTTGVSA